MREGARGWGSVGAALGLLLATAAVPGEERGGGGMDLVELTNGSVVVGVVPPLGGRVVLLKAAGGENLLDSDPKLWRPPYPPPAIDTPFKPWNGRIVWVGPQTGFWSQQDLKPDRKKDLAGWPPDPFNETGGGHGSVPYSDNLTKVQTPRRNSTAKSAAPTPKVSNQNPPKAKASP